MLNRNNFLVKTFSSVELAIVIITTIALTSIAGTIIPQNEPINFYVQRYGMQFAIIFELLDITSMYTSYWFQGLLLVFCLNLVICTWVRIPGVLAIIKKDSIAGKLTSMTSDPSTITLTSNHTFTKAEIQMVGTALAGFPHRTKSDESNRCHIFLHEKGAWSRTGAYIVHLSILLIIAGAIVGKYFGVEAFVMVPEGKSVSEVHVQSSGHTTIPLQFEIFCRNFTMEYYPNGTPKEYRSDLAVLENAEQVLSKSITVNDPLKYKGMTFFQASYRPIDNEFKLIVTRKDTTEQGEAGLKKTFFITPFSEQRFEKLGITFKILGTSNDGHGHGPYKVVFDDKENSPVSMIINDNEVASIDRSSSTYTFSLGQRYATGLKVVKDPGVWIVYLGCGLMMLGLYVSFFMSHIRVWVRLENGDKGAIISVSGKTNKNEAQLESIQEKIAGSLLAEESFTLRRV